MSDLTWCNHCTYLSIKARYAQERTDWRGHPQKVVLRGNELWLIRGTGNQRIEEQIAWFMQLTTHCVC